MKQSATKVSITCLLVLLSIASFSQETSWIRINQLGYPTRGSKVAVWCSKPSAAIQSFSVVDAVSGKTVYTGKAGKPYGSYGPFTETYRLNFSAFKTPGRYFLQTGNTKSPEFSIGDDVYKGAADFCLRYMRQQRSGFNPYLKDSCHTHDGYTLYGPMPDSSHIDVTGGWHDASDYLQYSTTSANATWHLLAAYRDFPGSFTDTKQANGLDGKNGVSDILDEAKWGLDWLVKMNPRPDWMFNQLGDDRDHIRMRIPKEDSMYGKGYERPVYFVSGKPQVRGKFMNVTTGAASIAGKFASAFALASDIYGYEGNKQLSRTFFEKAKSAFTYGLNMPGFAQTASVRSPYIYAESNWVDDMELAAAALHHSSANRNAGIPNTDYLQQAYGYARQEPVTPWLGTDTAHHYQWYPFINPGHYTLAAAAMNEKGWDRKKDTIIGFYKDGIEKVWNKAKQNAFFRGVPFIWCSNNLATAFAIQCYWYKQLTGSNAYTELEQANVDWLFGCNPWGTSMVYGLPSNGDTPVDPHSAFTHLKNYPIDGGLVDGPVYTAIYKNLIGIQLQDPDEYAAFQSDLAVYHDDYGDYSSNEPTMDGTASLIYLLAAQDHAAKIAPSTKWTAYPPSGHTYQQSHGAFLRGDSTKKQVAFIFTGDEFGDGLTTIHNVLQKQNIKGSFYFTGRFYRNPAFRSGITALHQQKNLLGLHSDQHLLYADWTRRDSTLVTKDSLFMDLWHNENAMREAGIAEADWKKFFIPPYEWWNNETSGWLKSAGYIPFSFTPGTTSNADYTWPEMGNRYRSSEDIIHNIKSFHINRPGKLNGAVILIHAGTDPRRTDKLYDRLEELILYLKKEGYSFKKVDELLGTN